MIAAAYVKWMQSCPIDIGNTCRRGIRRTMLQGTTEAAPAPDSAGNGAAMRNLPTVLATLHDEIAFEHTTIAQAHITHNHPLSDAGTLTLGRMTRRLIRGEGLSAAHAEVALLLEHLSEFRFSPWPGMTSGYIVDTVQTVFDAFFTTRSHGAGIGLAVVKRIVDDHGWSIDTIGTGDGGGRTSFRVEIPTES